MNGADAAIQALRMGNAAKICGHHALVTWQSYEL